MTMLLFALLQLCGLVIGDSLGSNGEMNAATKIEANLPLNTDQSPRWPTASPFITRPTPLITRPMPVMNLEPRATITVSTTKYATHTLTVRDIPTAVTIHS